MILLNFDTSRLYIHTELPWTPAPGKTSYLNLQQAWNWLDTMAKTSQEKAEVAEQEKESASWPSDTFGNGWANSLLGWALLGVDPFNPYGPDQGLQNEIKNIISGNGASDTEKSAKKQTDKTKEQSSDVDPASQGKTQGNNAPAANPVEQINQTLQLTLVWKNYSQHQKMSHETQDPKNPQPWDDRKKASLNVI